MKNKIVKTFEEHTENLTSDKLYTRDQVIKLLEDLYEDVAYKYDDYGRTDFSKESFEYVKRYMDDK